MDAAGKWAVAAVSAEGLENFTLALLVLAGIAWFIFQILVMVAVLRTARATEEAAHVQSMILRELRRYRPSE